MGTEPGINCKGSFEVFPLCRENIEENKYHFAEEYLDMLNKQRSGSIIRYSKNRAGPPDGDHVLELRMLSYNRSKSELERVAMALEKIKDKQGYEVIEMHYLQRKEGTDEIYPNLPKILYTGRHR